MRLDVAECPEYALGSLKAFPNPKRAATAPPPCSSYDKIIAGLPPYVVDELMRLGKPLMFYTSGELEDAVIGCHFDHHLIDDPNGVNFRDQLSLTDREIMEDNGEMDVHHWRGKLLSPSDEEHCALGC